MIPILISQTHQQMEHHTLLVGDIGATKTNLALLHFNSNNYSVLKEQTFHTKDFADLQQMIQNFLSDGRKPEVVSLGAAGFVKEGKVSLTNIHWEIDATALSQYFDGAPVYIINDIEALAYGLGSLNENDTHTIQNGKDSDQGNIGIIAPGTGLGEAGLFWDGVHHHPFATEGGHCDFAPRVPIDIELYTYLQKKFGHVSWERVISGPGIYSIFQFLRDKKEREEPSWLTEKLLVHNSPAVISEYATECAICAETMELFFRFLAYECANIALKMKATGGIYIGGGIVRQNLHLLDRHVFTKHFCSSGRLSDLLHEIPITIIANDKINLNGAAYYATHIAALNPTHQYSIP